MKIRDKFTRRLDRARHRAAQLWGRSHGSASTAVRQIVKRWTGLTPHDQRALAQFVRPQLHSRNFAARELLQPLVAIAALMALAVSVGLGGASLMLLVLAGWIIYAILTHIFGLEFELGLPEL